MADPTKNSVRHEPAFSDSSFAPDPAEKRAAPTGAPKQEIDRMLESVENEPGFDRGRGGVAFRQWLEQRGAACTRNGNLLVTAIAALVAGPFAVAGAFIAGQQGLSSAMYIVLFGPVTEELLKQSGMIYLLERKPYRIYSSWQFICAATVSAIAFAAIENLVYIHVYSAGMPKDELAAFAAFRWSVCTVLHVACSLIASMGLVRVWRHQAATGTPADLSKGFSLIAVAIAVHGIYNLAALMLSESFYQVGGNG